MPAGPASAPDQRRDDGGRHGSDSLRDRLTAWRDRLLMSPRFQHWAAGFPLTRPLARKRANALFNLCAGFVYSQILLAAIRVRLFETLAEGPKTAEDLSARIGLPLDGTLILLRATVALDLVETRSRDRYGLGGLGAALVGNPGIAAMIAHHEMLYADLRDPVSLLRQPPEDTELGRYWPYATADRPDSLSADAVAAYSSLMAVSQPMIAAEVLDAYRLGRHRCLLDVGGGEGAFLHAVAEREPRLDLMLFDLPAVAARAERKFEAAGLGARLQAHGGSFLSDDLPKGADIVSLVRVLHDHDDDVVLTILRKARAALPADGSLLIAEPLAETPGAKAVGDAYFGFYLRAMGSGRPRTPQVLESLLKQAGFARPRLLTTRNPMLTRVLVARPV